MGRNFQIPASIPFHASAVLHPPHSWHSYQRKRMRTCVFEYCSSCPPFLLLQGHFSVLSFSQRTLSMSLFQLALGRRNSRVHIEASDRSPPSSDSKKSSIEKKKTGSFSMNSAPSQTFQHEKSQQGPVTVAAAWGSDAVPPSEKAGNVLSAIDAALATGQRVDFLDGATDEQLQIFKACFGLVFAPTSTAPPQQGHS
eukprot:m.13709 g.13709  ORF g.13709 m.13709 type:complete len:197 (-) comp6258_c0_seq1:17-607(-)